MTFLAIELITSTAMQLFCVGCIAYVKWQYNAEEVNEPHRNASSRLNNTADGNGDVGIERQKTTSAVSEIHVDDLEANRTEGNKTAVEQRPSTSRFYPRLGNNVAYNKILFEGYHMLFLTFTIILHVTSQTVKMGLDPISILDIPRIVLYALDFGPIMLASIVLPFLIYVNHPEIHSYIKGCIGN